MSVIRLYEHEHTYLSVEKGRVYVKDIKTEEIASRAITLFPGVQIELGRDYHEIQDAIRQSRMPIFFKEIIKKNELTYLFMVRMGTEKIPTTELVTVICKNDIIHSMGFTGKTKEESYKQYLPGPDFSEWELTIRFHIILSALLKWFTYILRFCTSHFGIFSDLC